MSQPIQNLHDFVLNLITDDSFGSAFLTDPNTVLSDAGLGDITGLDVQDVTALVVDQVPATVADAVETGLASLPAEITGVNDLTSAVAHLETVAFVAQVVPATVAGLTTTTALTGDVDGLTGSVGVGYDAVQTSVPLAASTGGLATGALADTPAGAVTSAVAATTNSVGAGLQSPAGTYGVGTDSLPLGGSSFGSLGDLGSTLDSDVLTDGTPATAVAAGYVNSGGEFAAAGVANDTATVANHVSGGADVVSQTGGEAATHVSWATSTVTDVVSHVPAVPTPVQLPTDLPVHAVADLPQTLPTADVVPQVTHTVDSTVSHTSLTDSVSHGSLVDTAHSALPDVGDLHTDLLHGDLPLGH